MKRFQTRILLALSLFFAGSLQADVRLSKVFTDHMVLQQGQPVAIWGWAEPGEKVAVEVMGNKAEATAGADGKWLAKVMPPAAGGPYEVMVSGKNSVKLTDVLVGEVWICSGQS